MARKQNIEELLRSSLEDAQVQPSPRTWKRVERKLRMQRFLRFDPARINIWYMGALAVGLTLIVNLAERSNPVVKNPQQQPIPQTFVVEEDNAPERTGLISSEAPLREEKLREESPEVRKAEEALQEELNEKSLPALNKENTTSAEMESNVSSSETEELEDPPLPQAAFHMSAEKGCAPLKVQFTNQSHYAAYWNWSFGDGEYSTEEHPSHHYANAGTYVVKLEVSEGNRSAVVQRQVITVYDTPEASFMIGENLEGTLISGLSLLNYTAGAESWSWRFLGSREQSLQDWSSEDFQPDVAVEQIPEGAASVRLVAGNAEGCKDTLIRVLPLRLKENSERIKYPTAFTGSLSGPTGGHYSANENRSDVFHPHFIMEPARYHLRIFSRTGEVVYESVDPYRGWDGYIMEERARRGVYLWMAEGTWDNGSTFSLKGDVTLLWQDRR